LSVAELDAANERLVNSVNRTGEVFLSHTRLNGRVAIRMAIGHLRTQEADVRRAWELLTEHASKGADS
jgi:aromatic-L-amino-acid decarboxylase